MQYSERKREKYKDLRVLSLLLFFPLLLSGCSFLHLDTLFGSGEEEESFNGNAISHAQDVHISTEGLEMPNVPAGMEVENFQPLFTLDLLPYIVLYSSEENPELADIALERSSLLAMQRNIPAEQFTLEKRVEQDENEAVQIMQSFGYYSGEVHTEINYQSFPIIINIELDPHKEYTISQADIIYHDSYAQSMDSITVPLESLNNSPLEIVRPEDAPQNLYYFGLEENAVATAEDVLEALDQLTPWFHNRGYPFAEITRSRFFAVEDTNQFEAEINFNPQEFKLFGSIEIRGSDALSLEYVETVKTWEYGDVWNQFKLTQLKEELLAIGVFSYVDVRAAQPQEGSMYLDVIVELSDGFARTWGGGITYDTTRELGGQLFWEHRNLFGEAEKLRAELVLWKDLQEARITFIKPDLIFSGQDFNAILTFANEIEDAYEVNSATLDVGFDMPLQQGLLENSHFSYSLEAEIGREKDSDYDHSVDYYFVGIPLEYTRRNTDSVFDPSRGYTLYVNIGPYTGNYVEDFTLARAELNVATYFELMEEKKLILAARARIGSLYPSNLANIPASLRFYAGGGNSIRGYGYQEVGPEDRYENPVGGISLFEGSIELRYKVTDAISVVPFFDFGNVYDTSFPTLDFVYGTGIGMRYSTPIGPVRFDVAFPMDESYTLDISEYQLYISIGQTF